MWIKLIITAITLSLLFDESFKLRDKLSVQNRKIIVLPVLIILAIFSVTDVIIQVNEGDALVEKANKIIIQSDTLISNTNSIISDLEKNIESIEESGRSIIAIDSVLQGVRDSVSSQVVIIKKAVNKSAELVRLEEKKFMQDEANIVVYTNEISLQNNSKDSTFFDVKFDFRNLGKRNATEIKFENRAFIYNTVLKSVQSININDSFFNSMLAVSSKGSLSNMIPIAKDKLCNKFNVLIFVIKCEYKDAVTNKSITYMQHFLSEDIIKGSETKLKFTADYNRAETINKGILNDGFGDYLIPIE